jgi:RNA polymerase sigma-70 factor (ECF subfamily)
MLGDPADAEDGLQDTFLKAFAAYERIDGDANFRAWLYKIASNTAKTRLRRETQHLDLHSMEYAAAGPSVEAQAEQRIWLQRVRSAVEGLPYKQRASLLLRKYQDLSYSAIGEVLDSSAESARANVYQGLKKLKDQFAAELADLDAERAIATE